jgi:hypothetical protein
MEILSNPATSAIVSSSTFGLESIDIFVKEQYRVGNCRRAVQLYHRWAEQVFEFRQGDHVEALEDVDTLQ